MNVAFLIYIVIFMAIFYLTCARYQYCINVIIYTIGMGVIPQLFLFSGLGNLFVSILFRFVIAFIVVKILTAINDFFQNGVFFFISGLLLEGIISKIILNVIANIF